MSKQSTSGSQNKATTTNSGSDKKVESSKNEDEIIKRFIAQKLHEEAKNTKNPTKVKISKKDFFQHLTIALVIIVFFVGSLFMSEFEDDSYSTTGGTSSSASSPNDKAKPSLLESIQKMASQQQRDLYERIDAPLPSNPSIINDDKTASSSCKSKLFLTESSISFVSGLGLFTTQPIPKGQVILPSFEWMNDGNKNGESQPESDGTESESSLWHNMKHHETYANVHLVVSQSSSTNTKKSSLSWVASRPIIAGEELFIDMYQNPSSSSSSGANTSVNANTDNQMYPSITKYIIDKYQSLNPNVDSMDPYYTKVDDWTQTILEMIPTKKQQVYSSSNKKKSGRNYKQRKPKTKSSDEYIQVPVMDATPIYEFVKNTIVSEYDPILASLLPNTKQEAYSMIEAGGKRKYLSNVRPIAWIERHGSCVEGIAQDEVCNL